MDFKAEYKKSAEIMDPSPEAMERMKKNIMEQTAKLPAKKAIPFKKISIIGGAVAACAVITVSAVNLLPMIKTSDSMVANGTASHAMAAVDGADSIADRNIESEASKEEMHNSSSASPSADEDGNTGGMDVAADDLNTDVLDETCDICCDTKDHVDETGAAMDETCDYAETGAAGDTGEAPTDPPEVDPGETGEASTDPPEVDPGDTGEAPIDPPEVDPDETGEIACETSEPYFETVDTSCETGAAAETDEAVDDTEEAAPPITIKLSDDLSTAVLDGVKYVLTDDGTSPPQGDMEFSDRFDGTTEYWVDRYGSDYFVLSTMDGRLLGGYAKAN